MCKKIKHIFTPLNFKFLDVFGNLILNCNSFLNLKFKKLK